MKKKGNINNNYQQNENYKNYEDQLIQLCKAPLQSTLKALNTTIHGLTTEEAELRLEKYGPNELPQKKQQNLIVNILERFKSPLILQLLAICIIACLIGEIKSTFIVALMILLSVGLSFILDYKSNRAVESLGKRVQSRSVVLRDGKEREVKMSEIVPGDIVLLHVGSIVPADIRLISTKDFFVSESSLSGESMPVEKKADMIPSDTKSVFELSNACFFGTSVTSGTARGVVINTAAHTIFGAITEKLTEKRDKTSFDKGMKSFTWLMIRFMFVMVCAVFLIVGLTKGNWLEALLFSISIAVGLTPEMLPMMVTVNLAKGALTMAKRKVIIKYLPSIQNFGAIDILCTDKTGTLTEDRVVLERHVDIVGNTSEEVLSYAFLNSYFQTGPSNLIDKAILEHTDLYPEHTCQLIDELPFDFQRRRMSVIVNYEGDHVLICKGAVEEIYTICSHYQIDDEIYPLINIMRADLLEEVEKLNRDGFRVLGIAYKEFPQKKTTFSLADENNLILLGYIAFLDPPKFSATEALKLLRKAGVEIKVLTGDNILVTEKICHDVELKIKGSITGSELSELESTEFSKAIEEKNVFVKLTPIQKEEVVKTLRNNGHVVGFMGDGVNDAPALKAADVGISVDSAVDVAKEAADIVLLEKSLLVLEEGIMEGRKVFANIIKYIRMAASSNFGNMFSVVGASYILPFLPMQSIQILTNNLLYDFSQTGIPTDNVDSELIEKPLKWDISNIRRFMVYIGPISSIFDYATFALMWFVFGCGAYLNQGVNGAQKIYFMHLFQTGWFVESLLTQTLIVHIIRTRKTPFLESRASWSMMLTTFIIMAIGSSLPYSPFAYLLDLVPLPLTYWFWIIGFLITYSILTHIIKKWFLTKYGDK
jgi:Mg2+-importing ATPase